MLGEINGWECPAMPFLAIFQRNIENNVKFVAFLYIDIVEFVAK